MIHIHNLHKYYGDLHVLKGVSLDISSGEIVSIVGESGAGKSTLLQILGTLDRPSLGQHGETRLVLDGEDFTELSDRQLSLFRNQRIGFVFQYHQLLPEFTALENVLLPVRIAGGNLAEAKERAMDLLASLSVDSRHDHKPRQLSGGEAQRVAIARALIQNPKIIFADEPTGNLDSKNAEALHQLFFDLRDRLGQTFVIVTHNPALARRTDRTLSLRDGQLV